MPEALGLVEARSFAALVEAADVMLKAASVTLVGYERTGGGFVTAIVRGELTAVRAATDAGGRAAERVGAVVAVHVIANPHPGLNEIMPLSGNSRGVS